jgi:hypothetical protein
MTNISTEKCDEFKDFVENLIGKYNSSTGVGVEKLLVELYLYANKISQQYIPSRYLDGHRTGVYPTQLDYDMIMMSIVSVCWAVRMRKVKSQEGQCWEHKTNCDDTRTFHRERYDEWINIVEEALQALRSDPPPKITDKKMEVSLQVGHYILCPSRRLSSVFLSTVCPWPRYLSISFDVVFPCSNFFSLSG